MESIPYAGFTVLLRFSQPKGNEGSISIAHCPCAVTAFILDPVKPGKGALGEAQHHLAIVGPSHP